MQASSSCISAFLLEWRNQLPLREEQAGKASCHLSQLLSTHYLQRSVKGIQPQDSDLFLTSSFFSQIGSMRAEGAMLKMLTLNSRMEGSQASTPCFFLSPELRKHCALEQKKIFSCHLGSFAEIRVGEWQKGDGVLRHDQGGLGYLYLHLVSLLPKFFFLYPSQLYLNPLKTP